MSFARLWAAFGLVVLLSFAVLGWTGIRIYQSAPPVPDRVVTTDGRQIIGPGEIHDGQNVWYARSPEFLQTGVIETFRWLRVIGDTIFALGALAIAVFVIGLRTGGTTRHERFGVHVPAPAPGR